MTFAPSLGAAGLRDDQELERDTSIPCFTEFDPRVIPYHWDVLKLIRGNIFDYSLGTLEVLLSGAVGSAKSLLAAHLGLTHVLRNPGARLCLCRRSLPDLKATILQRMLDHMAPVLREGTDYVHNRVRNELNFLNGSQIICRSWADGKYLKFRSIELSAAIFEELTENDDYDKVAYRECKTRVGRLPHVKENWIISCTNPDSPQHWAYKYFFIDEKPTRKVFLSRTVDNPFLPKSYVDQLISDLDPKMKRRLVDGEWLEIQSEGVYYNYSRDTNFIKETYKVDESLPIHITHDFNIGMGKPMSAAAFQYLQDKDEFHVFKEWVIDGASTQEIYNEIGASGIFDHTTSFIINGDSSGKNRTTKDKRSDFDIILEWFNYFRNSRNEEIRPNIQITSVNPPIRTRHNMMNAYFKNAAGVSRLFVHEPCTTVDEAFRLTALVKGSGYVEDDSKPYQHIGTAVGYGVHQTLIYSRRKGSGTTQL